MYKGTKGNQLVKEIEKIEENSLATLALDELACQACRDVNEKACKDEKLTPQSEECSPAKKYKELLAGSKSGDVQEFTYA